MEDEFKLRYACPGCGAKIKIKSGPCPKCGFIGPMVHKDIRLRATDAYGRTVTVNPPPVPSDAGTRKTEEGTMAASRYKCPRCGAKAGKAFGECTNRKSCGYAGPMEAIVGGTKPKSK